MYYTPAIQSYLFAVCVMRRLDIVCVSSIPVVYTYQKSTGTRLVPVDSNSLPGAMQQKMLNRLFPKGGGRKTGSSIVVAAMEGILCVLHCVHKAPLGRKRSVSGRPNSLKKSRTHTKTPFYFSGTNLVQVLGPISLALVTGVVCLHIY